MSLGADRLYYRLHLLTSSFPSPSHIYSVLVFYFSLHFFCNSCFSLCLVLQVSGALTLPVTGEESEDQGHDWLSWPWWACLSAMAEAVAMGPGDFTGYHDNLDTARKQPRLSATVRVFSPAKVSVVPATAAHQHPRGHSYRDAAPGPQQEPAPLGAGGRPGTVPTTGGSGLQ